MLTYCRLWLVHKKWVNCRVALMQQAPTAIYFIAKPQASLPIALVSAAGDAVSAPSWTYADTSAATRASQCALGWLRVVSPMCWSWCNTSFDGPPACAGTRVRKHSRTRPRKFVFFLNTDPATHQRADLVHLPLLNLNGAKRRHGGILGQRHIGVSIAQCALLSSRGNHPRACQQHRKEQPDQHRNT